MCEAIDELKSAIKNLDTLYFENTIYRMFHKRSSITVFFEEHLKFPE